MTLAAVVVHGGAGNRPVADERPYHEALRAAVDTAVSVLAHGALAAAIAAVEVLEDAPLFNAGRGSVPTTEGTIEMDAAVMDGAGGRAGAVGAAGLALLGAGATVGLLGEPIVWRVLSRRGFDPPKAALVAVMIALPLALCAASVRALRRE